ncbi:hypothetical protein Pelo_3672 [Pelomyxa schiedti]|nr:hypothetical protein Pelo_3665 [Pelomyxa schiedti]KAH3764473.1 hypothetical protein Pelo_3672 [Pelomyxa schiedti]
MSATTEPEKAPDFAIPGVNQPLDKTKPRHMVTTIVHVSFKLVPLILYLFLYLFVDNFIMVFIIVTILVAMDFWATKNVTGRHASLHFNLFAHELSG